MSRRSVENIFHLAVVAQLCLLTKFICFVFMFLLIKVAMCALGTSFLFCVLCLRARYRVLTLEYTPIEIIQNFPAFVSHLLNPRGIVDIT